MAHKIKEDGVVWHAYGSLMAIGDVTLCGVILSDIFFDFVSPVVV
jgi:hypothetical protein